jgi:hypothetical protein
MAKTQSQGKIFHLFSRAANWKNRLHPLIFTAGRDASSSTRFIMLTTPPFNLTYRREDQFVISPKRDSDV